MNRIINPPTARGPAERFTGEVFVDLLVGGDEAGVTVGSVHFTPGAHTTWHSHARGQTLHCTEGLGLVVTADEVLVLRPGDTVWTPPGQRHWHGAAPERFLTHLAIGAAQAPGGEQPDVDWQEHVSDDDYRAAAASLA
ncbi:MAG: cupin domain-containing protein [Micropruina sp.]|nr:cupin domain-containing protein [Micropruina sp.]